MSLIQHPVMKYSILFITYSILIFYTVNSTIIICKSIYSNHSYYQEYKSMSDKKQKMDNEINLLKVKVSGLLEESLNKSMLEEAAKNTLGMIKSGEIVIIIDR